MKPLSVFRKVSDSSSSILHPNTYVRHGSKGSSKDKRAESASAESVERVLKLLDSQQDSTFYQREFHGNDDKDAVDVNVEQDDLANEFAATAASFDNPDANCNVENLQEQRFQLAATAGIVGEMSRPTSPTPTPTLIPSCPSSGYNNNDDNHKTKLLKKLWTNRFRNQNHNSSSGIFSLQDRGGGGASIDDSSQAVSSLSSRMVGASVLLSSWSVVHGRSSGRKTGFLQRSHSVNSRRGREEEERASSLDPPLAGRTNSQNHHHNQLIQVMDSYCGIEGQVVAEGRISRNQDYQNNTVSAQGNNGSRRGSSLPPRTTIDRVKQLSKSKGKNKPSSSSSSTFSNHRQQTQQDQNQLHLVQMVPQDNPRRTRHAHHKPQQQQDDSMTTLDGIKDGPLVPLKHHDTDETAICNSIGSYNNYGMFAKSVSSGGSSFSSMGSCNVSPFPVVMTMSNGNDGYGGGVDEMADANKAFPDQQDQPKQHRDVDQDHKHHKIEYEAKRGRKGRRRRNPKLIHEQDIEEQEFCASPTQNPNSKRSSSLTPRIRIASALFSSSSKEDKARYRRGSSLPRNMSAFSNAIANSASYSNNGNGNIDLITSTTSTAINATTKTTTANSNKPTTKKCKPKIHCVICNSRLHSGQYIKFCNLYFCNASHGMDGTSCFKCASCHCSLDIMLTLTSSSSSIGNSGSGRWNYSDSSSNSNSGDAFLKWTKVISNARGSVVQCGRCAMGAAFPSTYAVKETPVDEHRHQNYRQKQQQDQQHQHKHQQPDTKTDCAARIDASGMIVKSSDGTTSTTTTSKKSDPTTNDKSEESIIQTSKSKSGRKSPFKHSSFHSDKGPNPQLPKTPSITYKQYQTLQHQTQTYQDENTSLLTNNQHLTQAVADLSSINSENERREEELLEQIAILMEQKQKLMVENRELRMDFGEVVKENESLKFVLERVHERLGDVEYCCNG